MNLCSDRHDEIVFEGRDCPLCNSIVENEGLMRNIEDLEAQVEDLQDQLEEAKHE